MNPQFHAYLKNRIKQNGPLTVSQYMNLCLYHPEFGYYRNYNPLGQNGDFVTAPEISQMFGELIGLCFMDLWQRMGSPEKVHLIELGPGRGTLMQDFLRTISPDFRKAIDLHLVDISPILTKEQHKRINLVPAVWHDDIEAAFASCQTNPTFIVANEFFDALPIHQYIRKGHIWHECLIEEDDDQYKMTTLPLTEEAVLHQLPSSAEEGQVFEVCNGARYIAQRIAQHICQQSGMALTIDYGYATPTFGDTLQAVRSHKPHDFLVDPGTADLTAHVNFYALRDIAEQQGAVTYGPTTQGNFLTELGIDIRAAQLKKNSNPETIILIERTLRRLTHTDEMGDLFKVIAIGSPQTPEPCGFKTCIQQAA